MYTCMYVCIYIYIYTYVCIYIYICLLMHVSDLINGTLRCPACPRRKSASIDHVFPSPARTAHGRNKNLCSGRTSSSSRRSTIRSSSSWSCRYVYSQHIVYNSFRRRRSTSLQVRSGWMPDKLVLLLKDSSSPFPDGSDR